MRKIKLKNSYMDLCFPDIEYFVEKIDNNEKFSFSKLNHAFWDMVSGDSYWKEKFDLVHKDENFLKENIDSILEIPKDESFLIGVSNYGPPEIILKKNNSIETIEKYMSKRTNLFYGPLWKHYCKTGEIKKFIYSIRKKKVVVVGLSHLYQLKNVWGIPDFSHIEVDLFTATQDRYKILNQIKENKDSIIIFQCGEMLSLWFIRKLQNTDNTLIDMGRSLDLFCIMDFLNKNVSDAFFDIKYQKWINDFILENIRSFEKIVIIGRDSYLNKISISKDLNLIFLRKNDSCDLIDLPMTCALFINCTPKKEMKIPFYCLNQKGISFL